MIPGSSSENLLFLELNGFKVFRIVTHQLSEVRIQLAVAVGKDGIVSLRNRKPGETDVPGYETFEKKYKYIRSRGIMSPVYSVFGISNKEELMNIKKSGAQGAIIGNALMKLWNNKEAFCKLLDEFQSLVE
jgi:tryptophan synthase alpha subunit